VRAASNICKVVTPIDQGARIRDEGADAPIPVECSWTELRLHELDRPDLPGHTVAHVAAVHWGEALTLNACGRSA
jgi:hypothetical protein